MINPKALFNIQNLRKGSKYFFQCLENQHKLKDKRKIDQEIQPGFFKNIIQQNPPEEGSQIKSIVQTIERHILPVHLHSKNNSKNYSLNMSDTSILAEIFSSAFQNNGTSKAQLENIMMDWVAQSINLPAKFTSSGTGAGMISSSATDGLFTTVNAAKKRKMKQLGISLNNAQIIKFVGYCSDFCHKSTQQALILKDIAHIRVIKSNYNQKSKNFQIDYKDFQNKLKKDIQSGLIPFFFSGTYGSNLTGAVDINNQMINIARKYNLWISVDASAMGTALICHQNQISPQILQKIDSLLINFSKQLPMGNESLLLFVGNKDQISQKTNKKYDINYSGYQQLGDQIGGLQKRQNFFKFYFLFKYYGLKNLRILVKQMQNKAILFKSFAQAYPDIFQVHSHKFSLINIQIIDPITNKASNELIKKLGDKIKEMQKGCSKFVNFSDHQFISLSFDNLSLSQSDIIEYFKQIKKAAIQIQNIDRSQRQRNPDNQYALYMDFV